MWNVPAIYSVLSSVVASLPVAPGQVRRGMLGKVSFVPSHGKNTVGWKKRQPPIKRVNCAV